MRRSGSPREAIALLALGAFNAGLSMRAVEPMLPQLAEEFAVGVPAASGIITAYALAYTVAVLVQGPLGDRFGKLRVVTVSTGLAGIASLGCAFAWSLESLAVMRLATGMLASSAMALGMAYIGDVVPMAERQATIARFIVGSLVGQTLGPLFGGIFADWAGWRTSFAALALVFAAVAFVLWMRTAADWPAPRPGRFRPLAAHRALLARAPVRWTVAVGVLETFFFFGAYAFIGAFLRLRFDLSYTAIGLILGGFGIGGILYSLLARRLIRGLGERGLVLAGGLLCGAFYLGLALAAHWAVAIPSTIALGLTFYMLHNTVQARATEVAPDARGAMVALYASAWGFGQAIGVAVMGVAVAAAGYPAALIAWGVGFALVGIWLRSNLDRLKP